MEPKPIDIHDKAKAAIQAEQRQPADNGFKPSGAQQERPKPMPEKRFTEQRIPDFLKKQPEVPKEKVKEEEMKNEEKKKDQGVTVKFDQPTPKPLDIPPASQEPTVKPAPQAQPPISNPMAPAPKMQPEAPKAPPKDPFAQGDDGLTDIERALGGL